MKTKLYYYLSLFLVFISFSSEARVVFNQKTWVMTNGQAVALVFIFNPSDDAMVYFDQLSLDQLKSKHITVFPQNLVIPKGENRYFLLELKQAIADQELETYFPLKLYEIPVQAIRYQKQVSENEHSIDLFIRPNHAQATQVSDLEWVFYQSQGDHRLAVYNHSNRYIWLKELRVLIGDHPEERLGEFLLKPLQLNPIRSLKNWAVPDATVKVNYQLFSDDVSIYPSHVELGLNQIVTSEAN